MTIDASRNNDNVAFASASIILVASRKREMISPDFLVEKKDIGRWSTWSKYRNMIEVLSRWLIGSTNNVSNIEGKLGSCTLSTVDRNDFQ